MEVLLKIQEKNKAETSEGKEHATPKYERSR